MQPVGQRAGLLCGCVQFFFSRCDLFVAVYDGGELCGIAVAGCDQLRFGGDAVLLLQGVEGVEACGEFGEWVLSCTEEELLSAINRPIAPDFGVRVGE